jgi:hypothetical protein
MFKIATSRSSCSSMSRAYTRGKTSFESRNQPIVILVEMHLGQVALSSACSDGVGLRSIKVQKPATTACA